MRTRIKCDLYCTMCTNDIYENVLKISLIYSSTCTYIEYTFTFYLSLNINSF